MDTPSHAKKSKSSRPPDHSTVRVSRETRKRLLSDLAKVNKKDFGKLVRADALLTFALSFVRPEHLQQLQEESLSHRDRLDRDYQAYAAKHGPITTDEYLGRRLRGDIPNPNSPAIPEGKPL